MEQLIALTPAWEKAVELYKAEFYACGIDIDGTEGMDFEQGDYTSSTYLYIREEDNKLLGLLNLRSNLTKEEKKRIGNIGYSIRPSEQKKGYAISMLKSAVFLSIMQGVVPWYMVCREDNFASKSVILKLGGRKQTSFFDDKNGITLERYVVYDVFTQN